MKGRYERLNKEDLDLVVDDRIERLVRKLRSIRPALGHYEFLFRSELSWTKRDLGLRKVFAVLLLGFKMIKEKITNDVDPKTLLQIDRSIEELEEHVSPTRVRYRLFLENELAWIKKEKGIRRSLAKPLPGQRGGDVD